MAGGGRAHNGRPVPVPLGCADNATARPRMPADRRVWCIRARKLLFSRDYLLVLYALYMNGSFLKLLA